MEKVVVLMSTYNGERYLRTQMDSLIHQEGVDVEILVRDDGSSDGTLQILENYKIDGDLNINYYMGDNVGPARSFLDLMKYAPKADYYALCDQDDTWLPDKLKIAVDAIKKCYFKEQNNAISVVSGNYDETKKETNGHMDSGKCGISMEEVPVLYYGMPRFSDNEGNILKGPKGIYEKSLDFPSCLIKSNSTGCTMVFNRKLLEIINRKTPGPITMHDEWLHKVCLALDGKLIYDEDVHILYRQHGGNTIGGQLSFSKVMRRYLNTLFKPDCIRSMCIQSLIDCYGKEMSDYNFKLAKQVASYKDNCKMRLALLLNSEVKTPYEKRNILFKLAVLFGIF